VTVQRLENPPLQGLATALAEFERQFRYPLGPERSFRIAHGHDYPRFFRAMGRAGCFVAQGEDGRVLGTLAAVIRHLGYPDGQDEPVAYVADLKVDARACAGRTLLRLARAAHAWGAPQTHACFSVVMDGTRATPPKYTGRLGLPVFTAIAKVCVIHMPTSDGSDGLVHRTSDGAAGERIYRELSRGRHCSPGGRPAERSTLCPVWFLDSEGRACGRLEDTRKAKRLFDADGPELMSAHLSCFAFRDVNAGAAVVRAAAHAAGAMGYPALFFAAAEPDLASVQKQLGRLELTVAPATIYGAGLDAGSLWNINTAEI
jgi:hypothetical protein